MAKDLVDIKIRHHGKTKTYRLRKGLSLQALSQREDTPIEYDCRKADCGICIVTVRSGADQLSEKTAAEADFLRAMRAREDERLSCQCRVFGSVELEVEDII